MTAKNRCVCSASASETRDAHGWGLRVGWFWRRRRPPTRSERWRAFAGELEAQPAPAASERLRRFLDLDEAEVHHVHAVRHVGEPSLFVFDVLRRRRGPRGEVARWSSWALVRSDRTLAPTSFRAAPRRPEVLESLAASRTGSERVDLGAWPTLDAAVALFAREPDGVRALLSPSLADTLLRLLAVDPSTEVIVGQRHLIARLDVAESDEPARVKPLAGDLLLLSSLLRAGLEPGVDEMDFVELS